MKYLILFHQVTTSLLIYKGLNSSVSLSLPGITSLSASLKKRIQAPVERSLGRREVAEGRKARVGKEEDEGEEGWTGGKQEKMEEVGVGEMQLLFGAEVTQGKSILHQETFFSPQIFPT